MNLGNQQRGARLDLFGPPVSCSQFLIQNIHSCVILWAIGSRLVFTRLEPSGKSLAPPAVLCYCIHNRCPLIRLLPARFVLAVGVSVLEQPSEWPKNGGVPFCSPKTAFQKRHFHVGVYCFQGTGLRGLRNTQQFQERPPGFPAVCGEAGASLGQRVPKGN